MTTKRHIGLVWSHPVFARVLSLVLLGFIAYGTTVEAAHRHGQAINSGSVNSASSVTAPGDEVSTELVGCSDCLICQLQQHFSSAVITHGHLHTPDVRSTQVSATKTSNFLSLTAAPRTGRAPPATS